MNINDLVEQIVRMKGLVLEVNRTTIAERFRNLITENLRTIYGDDDPRTIAWIEEESANFMLACQLIAPRIPVEIDVDVAETALAIFIDKWSAVDTWRENDDDEWKVMSRETINVKATMLRELQEIANAKSTSTPREKSAVQQG